MVSKDCTLLIEGLYIVKVPIAGFEPATFYI